jgi:membrane dipeptidase
MSLLVKKMGVTFFALLLSQSALGHTSDTSNQSPKNKASQEKQAKQAKIFVATDKAKQLAQDYLIVDTHIDVPYRLEEKYEDVSHATDSGDFDYPRAVKGGLNAPFMSIYIPAELQTTGGSKALADKLIDGIEKMINQSPKKFAKGHTTADVEQAFANGHIALAMGMENGAPIEGKIENLHHFYQRGIRYITLTHSKANHISDSSYDTNRPAKGLTDFGKKLISEMNTLGMMIDVSHISDDAFTQVIELSTSPVIASHSSARHFTPGFERNMSDDMIKQLAKNGGVIQINFGSTFIKQESMVFYNQYKKDLASYLAKNKLKQDSAESKAFSKNYYKKTPFPFADLNDVLDHFDHVIKLVGVDHVGIGSDYDGVGDSLPIGLKDVASFPVLVQGFIDRGYSESDIAKILGGNFMRVWKQNEMNSQKRD